MVAEYFCVFHVMVLKFDPIEIMHRIFYSTKVCYDQKVHITIQIAYTFDSRMRCSQDSGLYRIRKD